MSTKLPANGVVYIPKKVIHDTTLTAEEKLTYFLILTLASANNSDCGSHEDLTELSQISDAELTDALNGLEHKGFIWRGTNRGHVFYHVRAEDLYSPAGSQEAGK